MTSPDPEERAEAILARWSAKVREGRLVREEWLEELVAEARPTVHSLLYAASIESGDSPPDLQRHEALAMATLFGRRLAALGMTPTVMMTLIPLLLEALEAEAVARDESLAVDLQTSCVEGFVRGREDRVAEEGDARVAATITRLELAPRVLAFFVAGDPTAEAIEAAVEDLGRALFAADAIACVVEVSSLAVESPRVARALFAVDETARIIGVRCIFDGVDERCRAEAERAGLDTSHIETSESFGAALRTALETARSDGRKGRWFGRRLEDLLRSR